jgi:hypothetical protein
LESRAARLNDRYWGAHPTSSEPGASKPNTVFGMAVIFVNSTLHGAYWRPKAVIFTGT